MHWTLQLAEVVNGHWRPAISDPTVYGWVTVVAYVWASFFCALCVRWAARLHPGPGRRRYVAFWGVLAVLLAMLAVNKQLDLQGLFGAWAKGLAKEQGWYEDRRKYQRLFIYGMAGGGAVAVLVMLAAMRGLLRQTWLAIIGVGVVGVFVLVRAASFHFVDSFLGLRIAGVATNWLLEWSGILLIGVAALRNLLASPADANSPPTTAQRTPRERR